MNASYTKFKPSNNEEPEMFWSSDGYFYLSVVHMKASSDEPFQKQYARIKVLQ